MKYFKKNVKEITYKLFWAKIRCLKEKNKEVEYYLKDLIKKI